MGARCSREGRKGRREGEADADGPLYHPVAVPASCFEQPTCVGGDLTAAGGQQVASANLRPRSLCRTRMGQGEGGQS